MFGEREVQVSVFCRHGKLPCNPCRTSCCAYSTRSRLPFRVRSRRENTAIKNQKRIRESSFLVTTVTGDCLTRAGPPARYGNGAPVVVRGRESRPHGEGGQ